MTALLTALGSGISANKILEYLMRKSPELAPKISKALASGLSAEKVVKFFSKDKNFEKLKQSMEKAYPMENNANPLVQAQNIRKQNLGNDPTSSFQRNAGSAIGATAGIGASMALSRAIPAILQRGVGALGAANPQSMQKMPQIGMQGTLPTSQPPMGPGPNSPGVQIMPNAPINFMEGAPQGMPPIASNPQATPQNIPQPTNLPQTINPQRDIKKSVDIIKSTGHEVTIKNMLEAGSSTQDIKDTLGFIVGKKKLKELEKASGGIEQAIEDYASSITQQQPEARQEITGQLAEPEMPIEESQVSTTVPTEEIENVQEEETKPISKNSTVSTPQGIGEVKEIRNGKALVEVDGKLHKVDEKDLEKPLFTDDEIADNYEKLMASIPEEHRSGFISWAGYDEDTGILGYIPRGGKYETLSNITPEEAELIKTGKGVARTSGKNTEGIWVLGGDTRGLISQIQHDRRRAREAEDKKQLRLFEEPERKKEDKGMKPLYDEMAYARGLSEARKKKAADEARAKKKADKETEKERLKREKNEAKKRKR